MFRWNKKKALTLVIDTVSFAASYTAGVVAGNMAMASTVSIATAYGITNGVALTVIGIGLFCIYVAPMTTLIISSMIYCYGLIESPKNQSRQQSKLSFAV